MPSPALIIHGGAGSKPKDAAPLRKSIDRILDAAYEKLIVSNAVEAVAFAVKLLEDDPLFNAGTGAALQSDGAARLSASVMDGSTEHFAAVINVKSILNPVLVAKSLLSEKFRVLSDKGAYEFAIQKLGMKPGDPRTEEAVERWKKGKSESHDTVGACALDAKGRLASATSTGGRGNETPGRVSDSAMPVASYADDFTAVSATGVGEEIMDHGLAIRIVTRVRDGMDLKDAFTKTFNEAREKKRKFGAVGLNALGEFAWDRTTESLLYGWRRGAERGFPG